MVEGNDLLSTIQQHSHSGSHIIVTVPPGPAVKAAKDKAQAELQQRASADGDSNVGREKDQQHAVVEMGAGAAGGVSTVQANMPHVTFEEPKDTLSRWACSCGCCQVVTPQARGQGVAQLFGRGSEHCAGQHATLLTVTFEEPKGTLSRWGCPCRWAGSSASGFACGLSAVVPPWCAH